MARFDRGWVKVQRRALLGDINSNFTRGGMFAALIAMANLQESVVSWKGEPIRLERGQILTSIQELSGLGGVDRSTILRHLNYLVLRGTITLEKSNKGILITFSNFAKYQGVDSERPHQDQHQAQHRPHIRHNIDPTHIEELKNSKKKKKKEYAFAFSLFVNQVEGLGAFEQFEAQIQTNEDFESLISALEKYKRILKANPWRSAKQSFAAFLGNQDDGFFWRGLIGSQDASEIATDRLSAAENQKYWLGVAKSLLVHSAANGEAELLAQIGNDSPWLLKVIEGIGGLHEVKKLSGVPGGTKALADRLEEETEKQHGGEHENGV